MPSSDLDDLFDTAAPSGAVPADAPVAAKQYLTRREMREAEAAAALAASAVEGPVVEAPAAVSAPVATAPFDAVRSLGFSLPDFPVTATQIIAAPIQDAPVQDAPVSRSSRRHNESTKTRKLGRADVARLHAGAHKADRKHPVSVLATFVVVGGLFAVAGLPAYALTPSETGGTTTTAASQSVTVSGQSAPVAALRDGYEATTSEEIALATRDNVRAANNAKYIASGARELGDDYPWPYELGSEQGGGLSVLNYYYRQCTDFVAWRINRDAGSYKAPYKWVWSNLTPTGGNASQWKYAWEQKGWPVDNVAAVGDVAWFGSTNHVAYVKQVLDGGYIVVEEYNYVQSVYGQRTILASTVEAFLGKPF